MKKLVGVLLALLVTVSAVYAEKNYTESDYSYVNVPILKIYEHNSAYVVVYRGAGTAVYQCAVPKSWFKQGTEARIGKVRSLPKGLQSYMTLIYREGEFSSIYLTVPSRHDDPVWGTLYGDDSQLPKQIDPATITTKL